MPIILPASGRARVFKVDSLWRRVMDPSPKFGDTIYNNYGGRDEKAAVGTGEAREASTTGGEVIEQIAS